MKFTLLYFTALLQNIKLLRSESILDEFKRELDVNAILVFISNTSSEIWQQQLNLNNHPKLIITNEIASDLRGSIGARVLSLIPIDVDMKESYLEQIVKPSLLKLHQKDVLFVTTESSTPALDKWHWLFEWCWHQGFWHVLLMNQHQQYLTMEPLPQMSVKAISLSEYLQHRHKRNANLQGHHLKVTVGNNPPRVSADFDENGNVKLSGLFGHAVKIFVSKFNATLEYVFMPNMSHYSVLKCMEYIGEQRADICADVVLFGSDIETTGPDFIAYSGLIVPFDRPLEMYKYFQKPFNIQTWLLILFTFISTLTLIIAVEYYQLQRFRFVNNFFINYESFICCSANLAHISQNYRYALEAILIFCGFMISNIYLAYLSSILLTKIYRQEISSLDDVVSHNLTILTSNFQQFVLEVSQASPLVRQQTILSNEEIILKNMRDLNPEYVYFGLDIELDYYLYQQKFMSRPRMKKLKDLVITSDIGGVPMRAYWPFQDLFVDFMIHMLSSGLSLYLYNEFTEEGIRTGKIAFIPNDSLSVEPLNLEYFVICGLVMSAGYIMAFISFILELVIYRKRKRE
uniref:Ionotropic glutamate receptor C-terminal domain-containing protein n=1 Tax=Stomoxys calcitrans TaxID=35570 RepID=A0A2Y9D4L3_STOCA